MKRKEKKIERVTVWMPPQLKEALERLAALEDRKPSEYIAHFLNVHVYGQCRKLDEHYHVANSTDKNQAELTGLQR